MVNRIGTSFAAYPFGIRSVAASFSEAATHRHSFGTGGGLQSQTLRAEEDEVRRHLHDLALAAKSIDVVAKNDLIIRSLRRRRSS